MIAKADDVSRTMALLWRSHTGAAASPSPGPKPRFEVDEVVEAAIDVADANPSGGISMRAVAERLGVSPMALYGYVPGKDALVALAYDAIHGEMPNHHHDPDPWRERVLSWAEDLVNLYLRHPWALRVSYARPVLGPNEQHVLEELIEVVRATDLGPGLLRRVVGMLFHAVRGTALTIADAMEAERSGISEKEWWESSSAALSGLVPDFVDRFPHTMWLLSGSGDASAAGGGGYVERQAMANLRAGLDVLLDGLESAKDVG